MSEKNEKEIALDEVPTLNYLESGAIGSETSKLKKSKSKTEVIVKEENFPSQKTAIFSTRNLYADGFGKINVGYNIIPNKSVDFWISQHGVRIATPEEVAEAFA